MNCDACGVQKDDSILELYPWPDEDCIADEPIEPFFTVSCQGYLDESIISPWKQCRVCHQCFHKLSPDMWISRNGWEHLNPVVSFDDLPLLPHRLV